MTKKQASPSSDWRTETLSRLRALIEQADPGIVEEQKWKKPSNGMRGVPDRMCAQARSNSAQAGSRCALWYAISTGNMRWNARYCEATTVSERPT